MIGRAAAAAASQPNGVPVRNASDATSASRSRRVCPLAIEELEHTLSDDAASDEAHAKPSERHKLGRPQGGVARREEPRLAETLGEPVGMYEKCVVPDLGGQVPER